ncbi:hypothetical protein HK13_06675 [Acetobacter indonesiensis]|nr:hypothetical protein HK13_06675 [Acetobacter indonesiensis]
MEHAFLDGFDDAPDLFLDLHLFHLPDIGVGAALAVEPVGLLGIGAHGFGRDLRCHHPVLQTGEHATFQVGAGDRPTIDAGAIRHMAGAGETVGTPQRVGTTALTAEQQTREQGFRATCAVEPVPLVVGANSLGDVDVFLGDDALSRLCGLPKGVIDDPKVGHFRDHPF